MREIKKLILRCLNCQFIWEEKEFPFNISEYITCPNCKKIVEANIIDIKTETPMVELHYIWNEGESLGFVTVKCDCGCKIEEDSINIINEYITCSNCKKKFQIRMKYWIEEIYYVNTIEELEKLLPTIPKQSTILFDEPVKQLGKKAILDIQKINNLQKLYRNKGIKIKRLNEEN